MSACAINIIPNYIPHLMCVRVVYALWMPTRKSSNVFVDRVGSRESMSQCSRPCYGS